MPERRDADHEAFTSLAVGVIGVFGALLATVFGADLADQTTFIQPLNTVLHAVVYTAVAEVVVCAAIAASGWYQLSSRRHR